MSVLDSIYDQFVGVASDPDRFPLERLAEFLVSAQLISGVPVLGADRLWPDGPFETLFDITSQGDALSILGGVETLLTRSDLDAGSFPDPKLATIRRIVGRTRGASPHLAVCGFVSTNTRKGGILVASTVPFPHVLRLKDDGEALDPAVADLAARVLAHVAGI